jgi:hypothetical protein
MKRLLPSIILVKYVESPVPVSQFPLNEVEEAARLIVEGEGIINPLVVRRNGFDEQMNEHYLVVEGHFECYAAKRARELDLRRGETINAYIIDADNENILKRQVFMFRASRTQRQSSSSTINLELVHERLTAVNKLSQQFVNEISALTTALAGHPVPTASETSSQETTPTADDKRPSTLDKEDTMPATDKKRTSTTEKKESPTTEKKRPASASKEEPATEKKRSATISKEEPATDKKRPAATNKEESATDKKRSTTTTVKKETPVENEKKRASPPEKKASTSTPVAKREEKSSPVSKGDAFINAINKTAKADLISKLKRAKITDKVINGILAEREKSPFTDTNNMMERVKGLGEATTKKITDLSW